MSLELIVFDSDGTFMDSEARIVACIQAAFVDRGCPTPTREAARDIIGLGLEQAMARLHPEADSRLLAELVAQIADGIFW